MKNAIVAIVILLQIQSFANPVRGTVFGIENNEKISLPGASVWWAGTTNGVLADENGIFEIEADKAAKQLVFSFVGFVSDTVVWSGESVLNGILSKNHELDEINVIQKNKGSYISSMNPIYTQQINSAELKKAACCNLSESFLTNPSVDVSYSDAITGAKQIKLLGLDGIYSQLQTENFPNMRGLATNYGLLYIPGPWLESIQVSKGTASVVNGFESVTGQINANFKMPDSPEVFHLNLYRSSIGQNEINSNYSLRLSEKLSTVFFIHGENFQNRMDENHDGFVDDPLIKQIHLFNQWKYFDGKGFMVHAGIHYLNDDRTGGQLDFRKDMQRSSSNPYGVNISTERAEAYLKVGYDFNSLAHSLAFISNVTWHDMESYYGLNNYSGNEYTFYGNLIHTYSIDQAGIHTLNSGLSVISDQADELLNSNSMNTNQTIPGVFSEYTFKPNPRITLMTGIRADHHPKFGAFYSPRFHLRYAAAEQLTLRFSGGKGYRSPRILAENSYLLANSRPVRILENEILEEAWNYGVSLNQELKLFERPMTLSAEYYRTDFLNQLITDRESSAEYISLEALNGKSYANSLQFEIRYEILPRLDLTAAYRVNDVKQTINNQLVIKPLSSKYKGLVALNYSDRLKKWMFDYTAQFNGGGRIPVIPGQNTVQETEFPAYTVMNAQVSKFFRKWDLYLGAENLLSYTQANPVLGADRPFDAGFDATRIWGPVQGLKIYAGIRITINNY